MNELSKGVVIRFVKAINDHDTNGIAKLMAEDHVFVDGMDQKFVGKETMRSGWESYFELFPDYKIEVLDVTENGSLIGLFGYAQATFRNLVNSANSNFWRVPVSLKAIVENNKVKHWQVYCDYSQLLKIVEMNK
jgi:ketosteroid isomerase-like protein